MKKQFTFAIIKVFIVGFLLIPFVESQAQSCIGDKGMPVIRIGFGDLFSVPDSLSSGKTTYTYTYNVCPAEGHYSFLDSVSSCFGNGWFPILPSAYTGKLMVVNASVIPGDVYVDTVKNLCGSTNYAFNASFINLSLPSSCSGHPLQPPDTYVYMIDLKNNGPLLKGIVVIVR